MAKLDLSIAIGDYDRIRPLASGVVQIDGVDPVFMHLKPEEIFFRAFRQQAFDVCELSLSTFVLRAAAGGERAQRELTDIECLLTESPKLPLEHENGVHAVDMDHSTASGRMRS